MPWAFCGSDRRAARAHHPGDALERSQVVQIDRFDADAVIEALLELCQHLHELKRIENPGLQQIDVQGRGSTWKVSTKRMRRRSMIVSNWVISALRSSAQARPQHFPGRSREDLGSTAPP